MNHYTDTYEDYKKYIHDNNLNEVEVEIYDAFLNDLEDGLYDCKENQEFIHYVDQIFADVIRLTGHIKVSKETEITVYEYDEESGKRTYRHCMSKPEFVFEPYYDRQGMEQPPTPIPMTCNMETMIQNVEKGFIRPLKK